MTWIATGGGWYEDEETGVRVRGKANIPDDTIGTDLAFSEPEEEFDPVPAMCDICARKTMHTVTVKAYTCKCCDSQMLR